MNFVTVASTNGNFTLLLAVVNYLDGLIPEGDTTTINLGAALSNDDAELTVFAPLDSAFAALAPTLGFDGDITSLADVGAFYTDPTKVDPGLLRTVVEYHVLGEAKDAASIIEAANAGDSLETLVGIDITLNDFASSFALGDQDLTSDDPIVLAAAELANIPASQGFIHVIDKVLLPADVDGAPDPTLLDLALTPGFEILVAVVGLLDQDTIDSGADNLLLGENLANPAQDLTVFAPTNQAFVNLAATLGFPGDTNAENPAVVSEATNYLVGLVTDGTLPIGTLRDVVEYHIAFGAKTAGEITAIGEAGQDLVTAGGTIDLSGFNFGEGQTALGDNDLTVTDPNVVAGNLFAANGVIHAIDNVLLPIDVFGDDPTILDIVLDLSGPVGDEDTPAFDDNPGDFDLLREAVVAVSDPEDPNSLLAAISDPDADLTVFAPTDGAFVSLSQTLGFAGSDEGGALDYLLDALNLLNQGNGAAPLLETVLKYHVSAGAQDFALIANTGEVATLLEDPDTPVQEATLVLGPDLTLVDADPDVADPALVPEAVDVRAANGVVHVIDGVLLPADLLQSDGSNDVDFEIGGRGRDFFNTGKDNDFIDAQGGRDHVYAGSGDDVVLAGSGRDFVNGGSGNDVLKGEGGRDNLFGGSGDDMIDGGSGRDKISGGSGDDTIAGGTGDDWLSGGFGEDTFVFEENGGHDTISFFWKGQDKIDLSAFGFSDFDEVDIERKGFFRSEIDLGSTEITVNHFFFGLSESDFIL